MQGNSRVTCCVCCGWQLHGGIRDGIGRTSLRHARTPTVCCIACIAAVDALNAAGECCCFSQALSELLLLMRRLLIICRTILTRSTTTRRAVLCTAAVRAAAAVVRLLIVLIVTLSTLTSRIVQFGIVTREGQRLVNQMFS